MAELKKPIEMKGAEIKLLKRIQVYDKEGNLIEDTGLQESHSWMQNILGFLGSILSDRDQAYTLTDYQGNGRTIPTKIYWDDDNRRLMSIVGGTLDYRGIVVGSGNLAEDYTQYNLETRITDGSGAGELEYGSNAWEVPEVTGGNVDFRLSRSYQNNSGGNVTIQEMGIFFYTSYSYPILVARDVLSSSVTIPDGGIAIATYTLRTTVSV